MVTGKERGDMSEENDDDALEVFNEGENGHYSKIYSLNR